MRSLKLIAALLLFCITLVKAQSNVRMLPYYDSRDQKSYYLAWDIKTGKSMQYSWNSTAFKYDAFKVNLPEQPVPSATGNILFDVYYDLTDKKAYYIAWDSKTGKSVQYSWNGSTFKYDAFSINLPEKPLAQVTGEVMIKAYYDIGDSKSYYLVYDTNGGHSMQYRWNGVEHKWEAFVVNLPEKPLEGK